MANLHYQLSWSKNYLLITPLRRSTTISLKTYSLYKISDCSSISLTDWLPHWLTDWPTNCHTDWMTDWLTDSYWLIDWPSDCHIDWLTDRLTVTLTDWLLQSCRNRMATHSISRKRLTCFFILSRLDRSCWVVQLLRYEDRHSARRHYHQEVLSLNLGYFYQQYLILSVQFYVLFWALFNWVS